MNDFDRANKKMNKAIPFVVILLIILGSGFSWNQKREEILVDWFPFLPENSYEPGLIGMQSWLDAPAGNHGFVQMENENLRFEDGTPIKFWGTNINGSNVFSEKKKAENFVEFLAKYGINAVRFHKFTWGAYDGVHSTRMDEQKFENLDYFQFKLREKGIYYGWSHIYGHRVLPGDSSQLLAYSEIKNLEYPWAHLNGSTAGLVNFAPDLQDLNIALTLDMLNHVNPHTGLRYADDPALAFVEFQNEDNIFWSAIEKSLEQAPTYRALLCRQFSAWLLEKYATQEKLETAWGKENIPEDESLDKMNLYPQPNHGLFSRTYEAALKEDRRMDRHVLDKMRFLYEKQMEFYEKFEKAVRDTGYKGVIVASCWQAGSGPSHLYNLHADYAVGMIDRHNYFGGGAGGHGLKTGIVKNNSMLEEPGSGLLSAGMQQVADRPFSFSEWMSLVPNQWTAEAAPIIAVYGMGLQGWDASFSFATDIPGFSPLLESDRHGVYNATSPLHIGLYPALARMIHRNDITESPVIGTRNVHVPSLEKGILGFEERVDQGYDDKRFSGSVSSKTLVIGRMPVKFTDTLQETMIPDLSAYHDEHGKSVISITNELFWSYGEKKYFTINTAATKGIVGFIPNKEIKLDDWEITSDNPFAVVLITSLSRDKGLNETDKILLITVAKARNSGMEYNDTGDLLLTKGTSPLLLEPVNLTLGIPDAAKYRVEILDHDGRSTGLFLPIDKGKVEIAGAESKSMYYLIEKI